MSEPVFNIYDVWDLNFYTKMWYCDTQTLYLGYTKAGQGGCGGFSGLLITGTSISLICIIQQWEDHVLGTEWVRGGEKGNSRRALDPGTRMHSSVVDEVGDMDNIADGIFIDTGRQMDDGALAMTTDGQMNDLRNSEGRSLIQDFDTWRLMHMCQMSRYWQTPSLYTQIQY